MSPETKDDAWRFAERALAWHGWGSPVGLGVFLVALGAFALLVRLALLGL